MSAGARDTETTSSSAEPAREAGELSMDRLRQRVVELEAAVSAMAGRLREVVRERDEFLSAAAHELKTPVTSIRGYSQVVLRRLEKGGAVDPVAVRRAMSQIDHQAERLGHLVNQLLDLSRLDAGRLVLNKQDAEITPLVRKTLAAFRRLHERREFVFEEGPGIVADVDPLRLEQVLVNLLDNAVKFSPPNTLIVVSLRPLGDRFQIAVRDYGMGIPGDKQERVFERFYQAHDDQWHGGIGLGLFVSREIAELHGGTVELQSPEDGGSRFLVTIPLGIAGHLSPA